MKKLSILFCIVTVLTLQTTAQVVPVVRTNLTDILVGRYSLGTGLFLQDQFSLGLDIDYISRNVFVGSNYLWYPGGDTHKRDIILEP